MLPIGNLYGMGGLDAISFPVDLLQTKWVVREYLVDNFIIFIGIAYDRMYNNFTTNIIIMIVFEQSTTLD